MDLQGKKIAVQFAKSKSDKTVEREEGEAALEKHKQKRLAEKEVKNKEWEEKEAERVRVQREKQAEEKRKAKSEGLEWPTKPATKTATGAPLKSGKAVQKKVQ